MRDNPEKVIYDYKYEALDNSGVLSLNEPWTDRPDLWLNAGNTYYMHLYDKNIIKSKPSIKADRYGQQLKVNGEGDIECYISVYCIQHCTTPE